MYLYFHFYVYLCLYLYFVCIYICSKNYFQIFPLPLGHVQPAFPMYLYLYLCLYLFGPLKYLSIWRGDETGYLERRYFKGRRPSTALKYLLLPLQVPGLIFYEYFSHALAENLVSNSHWLIHPQNQSFERLFRCLIQFPVHFEFIKPTFSWASSRYLCLLLTELMLTTYLVWLDLAEGGIKILPS